MSRWHHCYFNLYLNSPSLPPTNKGNFDIFSLVCIMHLFLLFLGKCPFKAIFSFKIIVLFFDYKCEEILYEVYNAI